MAIHESSTRTPFFSFAFLGLAFGYLLIWSGSIWLPIIAHLINNGAAVIFAWYAGLGELPFDQDTIGTGEGEWKLALVSIVLVFLTLLLIKRFAVKNSAIVR